MATSSSSNSARNGNAVRVRGTVAWFNLDKGYGFIKRDDGEKDVFVHYSGITPTPGIRRRDLLEGDTVEFEIVLGPQKKAQAVNVIKIAESPAALR